MNTWVEGARPKTLVASIVPVLVGTAAAHGESIPCHCAIRMLQIASLDWLRFILALVVSMSIQIAVNYSNDYFDAVKNVDIPERIGPRRLTASGAVTRSQMKTAIFTSFLVAGLAGGALALATTPWLIAVGAVAFVAALGYSGGPKPYASKGLGELFVFIFFGLVATAGSTYVQLERITKLAVVSAIPVGLLAVCILVVNNIRDIATDSRSGKITLAVRLGRSRTRALYNLLLLAAFASTIAVAAVAHSAWPLLPLLSLSLAVKPSMLVVTREDGPGLIQALIATARLQLVFGVLLAAGLWLR